MTDLKKFLEKLKESAKSVIPVTLTVLIVSLAFVRVPTDVMLSFLFGSALLTVGMCLFNIGSEFSMTAIGEVMGSKLTRSKKLALILAVSFLLGVAITIAEPDLQVLARNVPDINTTVLIITVSVGVGVFMVVSMFRILFGLRLNLILLILYAAVLLLALFADRSFLAVAFDSGGVTTGPITVPFIMAFGVGIASIRTDEKAQSDSFGLVALCSIGPILAVMLLGFIYKGDPETAAATAISRYSDTVQLGRGYILALPANIKEVLVALLPILAFFVVFQFALLKLRANRFIRIAVGLLYTSVGLTIFLTGVNVGFSPMGYMLGELLADEKLRLLLIPLATVMGWFIINAEPAVHALNVQVEELTAGTVSGRAMGLSLSAAVAIATGLSMYRVISSVSIFWFVIPGYVIALILTLFVPPVFSAIAFDSGGVASGPLTATFLLPMAMGASCAMGGNIMTDAFGLVAMVAMMPLITVQIMGVTYMIKTRKKVDIESLPGDTDVIELWG